MKKIAFKGDGTIETGKKIIKGLTDLGCQTTYLNGDTNGIYIKNHDHIDHIYVLPSDCTLVDINAYTKEHYPNEPLQVRMENMLCRIVGRTEMLLKNIEEYKEADDFENAMKNQIKYDCFKLIQDDLIKELKA